MMSDFSFILNKLSAFVKKYYANELLKGTILFIGLGFLIFLLVTGVEYVLWLNSNGRLILLLLLILTECYLLYKFIGIPLMYLLRIRKGLDNKTASVLIGKHFPEVSDKLTNLLDLSENQNKSDLLSASIEQKSKDLGKVPFMKAVSFNTSFRFLKVLMIPGLIIVVFALFGKLGTFFESYDRVKNYDVAYAPPAPFEFFLVNRDLNFLENEEVTIEVQTIGGLVPEEVIMNFDGREYLMKSNGNSFSYELGSSVASGAFYFSSNGYQSREYELVVDAVPVVNSFVMEFTYPSYLNRNEETVLGTGNAIVPEGTSVKWLLNTDNVEEVGYKDINGQSLFEREGDVFFLNKNVYNDVMYAIATSNENVKKHEELIYRLDVIKDEFPKIEVEQAVDSITPNESSYSGLVADDYGIVTTSLVYYDTDNPDNKKRLLLARNSGTGSSFEYVFPTGIEIVEGKEYELFFEVVDNDGVHGGKLTKSEIFRAAVLDDDNLREKELDSYKSVLDEFQKNIDKSSEQEEALDEINKSQKETQSMSFNDKKTLKDFLEKQKSQEEMMKSFSEKLSKDLERTKENNEFNELLKERLLRQELEAEKNRKLLEELNKVAEQIEKDELQKRLEELAKKQGSGKRNLEQLLELTKRYYVTEKANQLATKLENLANEQEQLSSDVEEDGAKEEQEKLNKQYNEVDKELNELKNDNQGLKKPMDLDIDKQTQEGVKKDQEEALKDLDNSSEEEQTSSDSQEQKEKNSSGKMNAAANKMKKLSEGLRQSMSMVGGGGSTIAEDAEMLRQILENLITFSFKQEDLFEKINVSDSDLGQSSFAVKKQQELRGMFEHVDDSLFALSLRQPELSEFVNEQITEVYYNVDKALESIAENQIYQGASYQQYVLSASNSLADYLAKMLDNMQQSLMSGQGQGQGDGFQLPDIIKSQQQLGEKMGQMSGSGKEGQQPQSGEGEKGSSGNQDGSEENGEGKTGEEGKKGKGNEKGGKQEGEGGSSGDGLAEENLNEIYEIYKQQQSIRNALEKQLSDMISNQDNQLAKKLVRQMESFENDLLENGITKRSINKMNTIQHELMKLENAALQQGKMKERESSTNDKSFEGPSKTNLGNERNRQPSIEILNRQALPLRNNMSKKVRGYFDGKD